MREAETEIAELLREHGSHEGAALSAYETLVEHVDVPGVRFLASIILEDERRHHRLIAEMLHQVESVLWEVDVEPQVPYLSPIVAPALREAIDELLEIEQADAEELRRLRKQVRSQSETSLLPLLADLMFHDTAKHIAILETLRRHTLAD